MLFLDGYLIVDEANIPIPVDEEKYKHLFQGADHIRAYVLTNLIEPASRAGLGKIRTHAGDVHKALDHRKAVRFHYFCMDLQHSDACFVKAFAEKRRSSPDLSKFSTESPRLTAPVRLPLDAKRGQQ